MSGNLWNPESSFESCESFHSNETSNNPSGCKQSLNGNVLKKKKRLIQKAVRRSNYPVGTVRLGKKKKTPRDIPLENYFSKYHMGTSKTETNEEGVDCEKSSETAKALKEQGNKFFKSLEYSKALGAYTQALKKCPETDLLALAILFSNRAACYFHMGEYELCVKDATDAIEIDGNFSKAYIRRFRGYEAIQNWNEALNDLNKALEIDPSLAPVYHTQKIQLEIQAKEQFEKDKAEMMDKLKSFGNWALGKVGLSLDNFKMEQNPESGAYNISFKQNPQ